MTTSQPHAQTQTPLREWVMFLLLGLIWGSSFLWIKVALGTGGTEGFSPLLLVTFRVLFGVSGLLALLRSQGLRLPRDRQTLTACALIGLFNTAIPFLLISWGETRIASGLAAILNGAQPLFTVVIAHFALHDEPVSRGKVAGLFAGFLGVVVLMSRDLGSGLGSIWGQLAVLAATVSYAGASTYARRTLRGMPPVVQACTPLLFASLYLVVAVAAFDRHVALPSRALPWLAVLWLGLLGSCVAYVLSFTLMNVWGATRTSLVTYIMPVVGLLLGAVVLGEPTDWRLLAGTALVVGGIGVVNARALLAAARPDVVAKI